MREGKENEKKERERVRRREARVEGRSNIAQEKAKGRERGGE